MSNSQPLLSNYTNLDTNRREDLITASWDLMRALTDAAGPSAAETMWNQLADIVNPELKHDLLLRMITGDLGGRIVRISGIGQNMIQCIKIIRAYTNMGLKEAKDVCDVVRSGRTQSIQLTDWNQRGRCVRELRDAGATVN